MVGKKGKDVMLREFVITFEDVRTNQILSIEYCNMCDCYRDGWINCTSYALMLLSTMNKYFVIKSIESR